MCELCLFCRPAPAYALFTIQINQKKKIKKKSKKKKKIGPLTAQVEWERKKNQIALWKEAAKRQNFALDFIAVRTVLYTVL